MKKKSIISLCIGFMALSASPVLAQNTDEFEQLLGSQVPSCRCVPMKIGDTVEFSK